MRIENALIRALAVTVVLLLFVSVPAWADKTAATGSVIVYDDIVGMTHSTDYTLTVDSIPITVEAFQDVHIARFAFSGSVDIAITVDDPIIDFNISPHSLSLTGTATANQLTFTLTEPSKLIVTINDGDKLFLFADPPESSPPTLCSPDVINIMDYDVDATGTVNEQAKIQQALNDVAALSNGGVLYFPSGTYKTGTLIVGSNTHIYLESGALIQGSYWESGTYTDKLPLSGGQQTTVSGLLSIIEEAHVTISGRGIIDADGKNHRAASVGGGRLIFAVQSEHIHIEDIMIRDSISWNTHVYHSDHISIENVKVVNSPDNLTTDGIDIDNSRDVMVDRVFVYTGDDSVVIKSGRWYILPRIPNRDVYNVTVQNSVLWSKAAGGMKVGTETEATSMQGIRFENNDIIYADIPLGLFVHDGTTLSDVTVIDTRVEEINPVQFYSHSKRQMFYFQIRKRSENSPAGIIRDIYIENFQSANYGTGNAYFMGFDNTHRVSDITFKDLTIEGIPRTSLIDARINTNAFVDNVVFLVSD
ncbi:glycosyl hydrolase family 28 protein [Paenibacillus oceani]|uniref:Pectate lyase superfamily protein domain-containing protein n=1 Tax=Paenibacillus oceani TaxID=2772510 RepID=A0A927CFH1_9BACL|nr:glycosyl hydrolase family 28 protein [Paenibacillus oceani]MBD2865977.1 hypothetical protein [Paenibacillus oceani]